MKAKWSSNNIYILWILLNEWKTSHYNRSNRRGATTEVFDDRSDLHNGFDFCLPELLRALYVGLRFSIHRSIAGCCSGFKQPSYTSVWIPILKQVQRMEWKASFPSTHAQPLLSHKFCDSKLRCPSCRRSSLIWSGDYQNTKIQIYEPQSSAAMKSATFLAFLRFTGGSRGLLKILVVDI